MSKRIDYASIEPDWRAGIKSPEQIVTEYNKRTGESITRPALLKHFKKEGIPRDLGPATGTPCAPFIPDDERSGFIYVVCFSDTAGETFHKIGMANDVKNRLTALQTSLPFEIRVVVSYFVTNMRYTERILHGMFQDKRARGEWFKLNSDDIDLICSRVRLM